MAPSGLRHRSDSCHITDTQRCCLLGRSKLHGPCPQAVGGHRQLLGVRICRAHCAGHLAEAAHQASGQPHQGEPGHLRMEHCCSVRDPVSAYRGRDAAVWICACTHNTCFCMQAASKVVSERPLTLLIPVVPLLLYTAMAFFWVWSTIYLFTICALSWLLTSYQPLSSRHGCHIPLAASQC